MIASALLACSVTVVSPAIAGPLTFGGWRTVVNNTQEIPPDTGRNFNSYNQPSINDAGLVVFRGRSSGGMSAGEPLTGVFTRDMSTDGNPINVIAMRNAVAPIPPLPPIANVTATGGTFNEFPAIPRIDQGSNTIATRGQTEPTLEVPDPNNPGSTTRVGTSGIYTNPTGTLITGQLNVGNIAGFEQFQVPGTTPGTKFDQFPGSPSVTDTSKIVFKGNWTDASGNGQTGVYWRDTSDPSNPAVRIADSTMAIPGTMTNFGSTAPPSAADGKAVFLGVDNEDNPMVGGIYSASLTNAPALNQIVGIGELAPGTDDLADGHFTRLGEALSYDGRYMAFWGAVGTATNAVVLECPTDGNQDVLDYCMLGPDGQPNTGDEFDNYEVMVPKYQGIFLADTLTGSIDLVASTWGSDGFTDFLYWGFTGRPPGVGNPADEGLELARWRSTSFVAVDNGMVAFKGSKGDAFGLYVSSGGSGSLTTLAESGGDGALIDPDAAGMSITALGIERDGFRNGRIAISASMANADSSMAGVYVNSVVPEPTSLALAGFAGIGMAVGAWRRRRQQKPLA